MIPEDDYLSELFEDGWDEVESSAKPEPKGPTMRNPDYFVATPRSSMTKELEYDPDTFEVLVTWNKGKPGYYEGVPFNWWTSIKAAASNPTCSFGEYMREHIIPNFTYRTKT